MSHKDAEVRKEYEHKRNQDPERKRKRSERAAKWKKDHPEATREARQKYMLKWRYGLTPEEYKEMYELQGGKCANEQCKRPAEYIDHDHATNEVRGLLCKQCNFAIGLLLDDPDMVRGIENYLKRYQHVNN